MLQHESISDGSGKDKQKDLESTQSSKMTDSAYTNNDLHRGF